MHDVCSGPNCLIDAIRFWDYLDSEDQARQQAEMMKGR